MTGFGRGAAGETGILVRVEVSSVNRRNLDVQVNLPRNFAPLEARCQRKIQDAVHRGRVQVRVDVVAEENGGGVHLDAFRLEAALELLNAFAAARQLAPVTDVGVLLRVPGIWQESVSAPEDDLVAGLLDAALDAALKELLDMRAREGAHLAEALREQLTELAEVLEQLSPRVAEAREELIARFRAAMQALNQDPDAADARLWQEVALYAERSDIREELDRIQGHLMHAKEKMSMEGPCGRALDFLCQELAREFNTLSVKAARADINRLALLGKERVEMFREQVQNIE